MPGTMLVNQNTTRLQQSFKLNVGGKGLTSNAQTIVQEFQAHLLEVYTEPQADSGGITSFLPKITLPDLPPD